MLQRRILDGHARRRFAGHLDRAVEGAPACLSHQIVEGSTLGARHPLVQPVLHGQNVSGRAVAVVLEAREPDQSARRPSKDVLVDDSRCPVARHAPSPLHHRRRLLLPRRALCRARGLQRGGERGGGPCPHGRRCGEGPAGKAGRQGGPQAQHSRRQANHVPSRIRRRSADTAPVDGRASFTDFFPDLSRSVESRDRDPAGSSFFPLSILVSSEWHDML